MSRSALLYRACVVAKATGLCLPQNPVTTRAVGNALYRSYKRMRCCTNAISQTCLVHWDTGLPALDTLLVNNNIVESDATQLHLHHDRHSGIVTTRSQQVLK